MIRVSQLCSSGGLSLGALSLWLLSAALISPQPLTALNQTSGVAVDMAGTADTLGLILGPSQCAECHLAEFEVWKISSHESGSKMLTRSKEAKAIAKALGIRRIKSHSRCTSCHFTMKTETGKPKALAGVSCESCHGAAKNWMDSHQNFGSKGSLIGDETKRHRKQRLQDCDSAGMVRPGKVHAMAGQCFICHIVDDEELVDLGGHPSGSDFELLSWSQGEVRHNFVRGQKHNVEASQARKRMLYIAGQMQELNYSMQALAGAKGGGSFEAQNIMRAERSIKNLRRIRELTSLPEIDSVLQGSADWIIQAGCRAEAELLSQRVEHCSVVLEMRTDGSEFSAIDAMLPGTEVVRGAPPK